MTKTVAAIFLVCASAVGLAQESPTPTPSPNESFTPLPTPTPAATRTVRISFVPPPIEGTISLGIYDPSGKLMRVLHRESETDDFTIGHDALITEWDGKNDSGENVPAGKYNARGYAVGSLGVEGVDLFFNDWVDDENSPHIKRINELALMADGLRLDAELASGEHAQFFYDFVHDTLAIDGAESGRQNIPGSKDGTRWVIAGSDIQQLSPTNEILRHLAYAPGDPQPKVIVASDREDKIFVLEENQTLQRVRGLTLVKTTADAANQQTISDWKVDLQKDIVAHKDFSLADGKPVVTGGQTTMEKLTLRLRPNPLKRDKPGSVEVTVGFDKDGSFLKTTDGLPLRTISDTPHLTSRAARREWCKSD